MTCASHAVCVHTSPPPPHMIVIFLSYCVNSDGNIRFLGIDHIFSLVSIP